MPTSLRPSLKLADEFAGYVLQLDAISKSHATVTFDLNGLILSANQNFLDIFGYTLSEIEGHHHGIFVEPDYRESAEYKHFWSSLTAGRFQAAEYKRISKDGREVWLQASYNPIIGSDGLPFKIMKLATDVTERKRIHAALAGQIAAIEKSQAIIEFRLDGMILNANENFLAAVGYELDELQGKHHRVLVDLVYRESAEYQKFWESLSKGEYQGAEYRRIRKDGGEVWFQATYNPVFGLDGKAFKIVKIATDVTTQKLKSAKLASQANAISQSQAVIEFDMNGTVLSANENYLAMLGYDLDEIEGKDHSLFVDPAYRKTAAYRQFWEALRKGEFQAAEFQRIGNNGREIWLQASYNPILDLRGVPFKVVKVATDITARKLAETQLVVLEAKFLALIDAPIDTKLRLFESIVIHAKDAIIITDAEPHNLPGPHIVYANPAFTAMSGYSAAEVFGKAPRMLQGPLTGTEAPATIRAALAIWQPVQVEILNYHKNGTPFWVELSISPLCDENGWCTHWISVQRDITARKLLQEELRLVTTRMTLAADAGEIGILELDIQKDLMVADEWATRILGIKNLPGKGLPHNIWKLCVHPDDRDRRDQACSDAIAGVSPYQLEYRITRDDGSVRHLNCSAQITRDATGQALRMTGPIQDITQRKVIEAALAEAAKESRRLTGELTAQHKFLEVTLKSIGDAVVCTDVEGNVTFTNMAAEELLGVPPRALKGPPIAEIVRMIDTCSQDMGSLPMKGSGIPLNLPADYVLRRNDGYEIAVEGCVASINDRDRDSGKVIVFRDVSAARAIAQQVKRAAHHDLLTGLPNRLLLSDRIDQAITMALRYGKKVGVLFLDLDGFKHVNDSLGHQVGDKLLISVSSRLQGCVRGSDTVSRQGGDEFIALLAEMSGPEDAGIIAQRFLEAVAETHVIDGRDLHVTASIGISVYPEDGSDAATLFKAADTAMYKVKAGGRQGYQFFEAAMRAGAIERQYIEENLRRAIKDGEFLLNYQPKIDIRTGAITGAEALIRWVHPERGSISPASFIPVAEDCGLIRTLGSWVLREACEQGRRWSEAGLPPITIAVNISPIELGKEDFLGDVVTILRDTGFDPKYLELEMTEGVLMERAGSTQSTLKTLKAMGLRLAIDDFGTGYSSLSYLTKFPIDTIKIDQSFVRQISTDPTETAIVTAVISMAHSLNLVVVAEGVETREELDFLSNLGCDEAQGYYFSRPVPAGLFPSLLSDAALGQRKERELLA